MSRLKFKLTLAFDGAAYHGWQGQRSGRGVQNQVENALSRIFPSAPTLQASSRTDTGVHAYGLVVHFEVPQEEFVMPVQRLTLALNACLPEDVRVRAASRVPLTFDARFDAKGKEYRYEVWNDPVMNPLIRGQAWHVPRSLDLLGMKAAAAHFVGRHDFSSFTSTRDGELGDPFRTLTRCEVRRRGARMTFVIEGAGFLYKMCRGIVGTLVQVGEGKFRPDEVQEMLLCQDRRVSGVNAPAHGLILWKVIY